MTKKDYSEQLKILKSKNKSYSYSDKKRALKEIKLKDIKEDEDLRGKLQKISKDKNNSVSSNVHRRLRAIS